MRLSNHELKVVMTAAARVPSIYRSKFLEAVAKRTYGGDVVNAVGSLIRDVEVRGLIAIDDVVDAR
jgi:hypothetical protein